MPLEDGHDLERYVVDEPCIAYPRTMPKPVIGMGCVNVDRSTPGMHARLSGVGDGAAVICTSWRIAVSLDRIGQGVELPGDRGKPRGYTIDRGDSNRVAP